MAYRLVLHRLRDLGQALAAEVRRHLDDGADSGRAELRLAYEQAIATTRTSSSWQQWRDERTEQLALGWLLGTTFVRYAEDNGVLPVTEPSTDDARGWWLSRFSALAARLSTTPDQIAPTAQGMSEDGARMLINFWHRLDGPSGAPIDLTDPPLGTRIFGDLYQDLSEADRRRYSLLQTPAFVERFILDQTLEPAIDQFGFVGIRLLDPVCGSGSFLLGAFDRLFTRWVAAAPETPAAELVQRTLASLHGVDLNPSAVFITRFRLLIAAHKACLGSSRTDVGTAEVPLSIVAGDALLDDANGSSQQPGLLRRDWYHVVVGNPPYITVQDRTLNALYRQRYSACTGKYALTVPFIQRFFELACSGDDDNAGYVGLLAGNSFTKREFGRKLIEEFLADQVSVTNVVDTSGAFIPGHGTPTLILVGRNRPGRDTDQVSIIAGLRGEPSTPDDPARGLVWQSILRHVGRPSTSDEWTESVTVPQSSLRSFPWQLSGGAPAAVMQQLASDNNLSKIVTRISYLANTGADDIFTAPADVWSRQGTETAQVVNVVTGSDVRDWTVTPTQAGFFPRGKDLDLLDITGLPGHYRRLWPFRTVLGNRADYSGQTFFNSRRSWHDWHTVSGHPDQTDVRIVFPWVATHPHFAILESATALPSAPVIELKPQLSPIDRANLVAFLNSSTACFWLKQMSQHKGISSVHRTTGNKGEPWETIYEYTPGRLRELPIPTEITTRYADELERLARICAESTPARTLATGKPNSTRLADARSEWEAARARMIALAEEQDWEIYARFGLLPEPQLASSVAEIPSLKVGERAFEIALARQIGAGMVPQTHWFPRHAAAPITELPEHWPQAYCDLVEARIRAINTDRNLRVLERPEFKRRWTTTIDWPRMQHQALRAWLLARCDAADLWYTQHDGVRYPRPHSVATLADALRADTSVIDAVALYAPTENFVKVFRDLVEDVHVPCPAAARFKESGIAKWESWRVTWEQQRMEDRARSAGDLNTADKIRSATLAPSRYTSTDFRRTSFWHLRGKYDVPREVLISYPIPESNEHGLLLGWAGWSHADRAFVLINLVEERLTAEEPDGDSLVALLAALHEVLEWVAGEQEAKHSQNLDYLDLLSGWLDRLNLTERDLRGWRPKLPRRGRPPKQRLP